ncbi:MAG: YceI family protein [Deltaproteobacteria bacterium]|nr:YceI family protein [Deltaproteobacteria bacterium]
MWRSLLILPLLFCTNAHGQPRRLTLDGAQSSFVVRLFKAGLAARLAHDHVIRAKQPRGTIEISGSLTSARIQIEVDARTLEVDPPELRRRYKLTSRIDHDDRKKITHNLHAKDQLWSARHKTIRFVSTAISALGGDRYKVMGRLTLRGITRAMNLSVQATLKGDELRAKGTLRFLQSNFGYKPYRAALGLVKVKDGVDLDLYLVARPTSKR